MSPVLRVSRHTFAENLNWTASAETAWSDNQVDGIIDAAWDALDIDGLDLDRLDIEITRDAAPRSACVVGGDGGTNDEAILRRWDAAVEAAAGDT